MVIRLNPDVNNTGAATLNIDGLGAKPIKVLSAGALADPADNAIDADWIYTLIYDGTNFLLQPGG